MGATQGFDPQRQDSDCWHWSCKAQGAHAYFQEAILNSTIGFFIYRMILYHVSIILYTRDDPFIVYHACIILCVGGRCIMYIHVVSILCHFL